MWFYVQWFYLNLILIKHGLFFNVFNIFVLLIFLLANFVNRKKKSEDFYLKSFFLLFSLHIIFMFYVRCMKNIIDISKDALVYNLSNNIFLFLFLKLCSNASICEWGLFIKYVTMHALLNSHTLNCWVFSWSRIKPQSFLNFSYLLLRWYKWFYSYNQKIICKSLQNSSSLIPKRKFWTKIDCTACA